VLCRFTAFVAADVQVVNEGGVVHRVLQPVEAPAGWTMFERVGLAAAAMPMARMSAGGLRNATSGGSGGLLGKTDRRPGALRGRGPGRSAQRRLGGFASDPLAGADLAPYRRRAAQLAALLESDPSLPRLGGQPVAGARTEPDLAGRDLERRLGLVRVGVMALVADLESVDAVEEEVRPLRDLAAGLARVAGPGGSRGAELERVRERALAVLWAFATQGAPNAPGGRQGWEAPPGRDPGFWKR
jgi:Ca-activated chloride channel family protein